jgi:cytoskeletal protein CcmA (bactofilin family)
MAKKMKDTNNNTGSNHNMIAAGTKIIGTIETETDIRIDGEIEGEIISKSKVIIGSTGFVKGKINCDSATVMGTINGTLIASDIVSLAQSAKFTGEIETNVIAIEPDAYFSGTCKMPKKDLIVKPLKEKE